MYIYIYTHTLTKALMDTANKDQQPKQKFDSLTLSSYYKLATLHLQMALMTLQRKYWHE